MNAQIRKFEMMTEDLSTSHERMLSKIKAELTDKEKQRLTTAFAGMQAAIEAICDQYVQD